MLLSGIYAGPAVYVIIPLLALLLIVRGYYTEALLNFFLILILSDSRNSSLSFAVDVKNIYILLLGVSFLFIPRNDTPYEKTIVRFLPFLLIALFCLLFRETLMTGLQKTISYALLLLVVPNYIFLAWRKEGVKFLQALVWFTILLLVLGLVFWFVSPDLVLLDGRYSGILGNPNGLGLFCLLFFILTRIIGISWPDFFGRWERIIIIAVIFLSVWLCGSRNSLFAMLLFLFFGYFYRMSPFIGFISFLLSMIAYTLIITNLPAIIVSLGLEEFLRLDTLEDASGRFVAWQFGWEFIQQDIVFGKGLGYTDELYKKYYAYLSIQGHQGNAHNSYITFWLDTGVFGLLFFLRGLISSFIRGSSENRYAMPALYAIAFTAFFESWMTASLNPFTIQLLMIITFLSAKFLPEVLPSSSGIHTEQSKPTTLPV